MAFLLFAAWFLGEIREEVILPGKVGSSLSVRAIRVDPTENRIVVLQSLLFPSGTTASMVNARSEFRVWQRWKGSDKRLSLSLMAAGDFEAAYGLGIDKKGTILVAESRGYMTIEFNGDNVSRMMRGKTERKPFVTRGGEWIQVEEMLAHRGEKGKRELAEIGGEIIGSSELLDVGVARTDEGAIRVFRFEDGVAILEIKNKELGRLVGVSRSGKYVAFANRDQSGIMVVEVANRRRIGIETRGLVYCCEFSPEEKAIAIGTEVGAGGVYVAALVGTRLVRHEYIRDRGDASGVTAASWATESALWVGYSNGDISRIEVEWP